MKLEHTKNGLCYVVGVFYIMRFSLPFIHI